MLSPRPAQLSQLIRSLKRASYVAKDGLLLVMNAVLNVRWAPELMHRKAHYFPARSTGNCDENAEKGDEEIAIAFTEGYGRAEDASSRPINPWTNVDERCSGLGHFGSAIDS